MRRLICCFAAAVAAISAVAGTCDAGILSSVSSSNNAIAKVTNIVGISTTPGAINTGTVTVDLEVYKLHAPISLNFSYIAGGASILTTYTVTLNIKNALPDPSDYFNGFDLTRSANASGDVVSSGLVGSVAPTSNVFAIEYAGTTNITNGFRWGGLNGGGPSLPSGSVATNTFDYRVTFAGTGAGTSALNFTANPEPTTLLLGSLVMGPAAYAMRRRRKQQAQQHVEVA